MICVGSLQAQTFTITDSMQWKAYDDFNAALLDKTRNIYKADTEQKAADHRGNGARDNDRSGCAAAIWCQAIYYDMVINAYNRAKTEGNEELMKKYKALHDKMYSGEKSHYVNFNFDDPNTNNGWFVYDDIMRKAMSDLKFKGAAENADYFADVCFKMCGERIRIFDPRV